MMIARAASMALVSGLVISGLASGAIAQQPSEADAKRRPVPVTIHAPKVEFRPISGTGVEVEAPGDGTTRDCAAVSTHTDANFAGGSFVVQAGFAEGEIAASEYVLDPSKFPIKIDLCEFIIAQSAAIVSTTTHWSVLVWQGPPGTGTLVASYSSDDIVIPHLRMPPGTQGTNVQFLIDPGDPDQIIINANPTNSFSIGFRIDKHNNQTANPCFTAPPSNQNAFPTTDISGLAQPTRNWLFGLNCGSFGCPPNGGWARFSTLASFCRPTGDWVMRATWTSLACTPGVGACCLPDGSCLIATTTDCANANGVFKGDGSTCATAGCTAASQACCFPATGGCLNLSPSDCTTAGGVPGGVGTACATFTCFPKGACCLPDGSCIGNISPTDCGSLGGTYQGNNTSCGSVNCPPPTGACCFPNGSCLVLTQADCGTAGGAWAGIATTCADGNGNGTADACESDCRADVNGDGELDILDFLDFFDSFGECSGLPGPCVGGSGVDADYNEDLLVDILDLLDFMDDFGRGC
ncbi:MAG: hypothetical protein KF902_14785 [Phycisphaeraceae bacterium]|nr:hypothetical protein [Phycisphaeraceae bacterium]